MHTNTHRGYQVEARTWKCVFLSRRCRNCKPERMPGQTEVKGHSRRGTCREQGAIIATTSVLIYNSLNFRLRLWFYAEAAANCELTWQHMHNQGNFGGD